MSGNCLSGHLMVYDAVFNVVASSMKSFVHTSDFIAFCITNIHFGRGPCATRVEQCPTDCMSLDLPIEREGVWGLNGAPTLSSCMTSALDQCLNSKLDRFSGSVNQWRWLLRLGYHKASYFDDRL
jgi:hypothetical protein